MRITLERLSFWRGNLRGALFKALKLVYWNKKTGGLRYEAWYSLELKQLVKMRENLDSGMRIRELIAFKLR